MISRRAFIKSLGVCGLGAVGAGAYGVRANTTNALELHRIDVAIPNLPSPFEGYTIGFVSDMHLGHYVATDLIAESARLLRDERCDLIALGGDYIWLPDDDKVWPKTNGDFRGVAHSDMPSAVFERIAAIYTPLSPPDGVAAVLGNHDGWIDPNACARILTARGIAVLENRAVTVRRGEANLHIGGVADLWTGFPHLPPMERGTNSAVVLLAHNPDYVSELLALGVRSFDLALCGHTHGGQIRLPVVGVLFDNIDDKRFVSGLFESPTGSVYTSKGLGVVEIPLRLNCPPEVSVIRLHAV